MRALLPLLFLSALSASAWAQTSPAHGPGLPSSRFQTPAPQDAIICLEPSGTARGTQCKRTSLTGPSDFCDCPFGTTKVYASVCNPGQTPPPENADYMAFRAKASAKDGTLVGKTYKGQPICVNGPVQIP
jgi:hypothetical protein